MTSQIDTKNFIHFIIRSGGTKVPFVPVAKLKGSITLITPDDGMRPLRAGTETGIADSLRKAMMPIMARRPLFTSDFNLAAFHSSLLPFCRPKGSKSAKGTGWGAGNGSSKNDG